MVFNEERGPQCKIYVIVLALGLSSLTLVWPTEISNRLYYTVARMQHAGGVSTRSISNIKKLGVAGVSTSNASVRREQKPKLILHVGPSKSATTSLQTDLTDVQAELESDGYLYAGRYYNPYTDSKSGKYILNRSETSLLTEAHEMLKDCSLEPRVQCCRSFLHALNEFIKDKPQRNIILSEEPFGNAWKRPADWEAIRDAVSHKWDVTVVVGYRRFYEWLPSARYQRERTDRNPSDKKPWPGTQAGGGGRAIGPFFPDWWDHWHRNFAYTGNILDAIGSTFPVQILNLHNEDKFSPLTSLLCVILNDETPTACTQSIDKDHAATVMNTHASAPSLLYDGLATAAADRGLINRTAWSRGSIRDAIRVFQEETLQLSAEKLALDCPSQEQLDTLWNMSQYMEETYVPAFSASPLQKAEHLSGFQMYVSRKVYCWIDGAATLHETAWKTFFSQYT